MKSSNKSPYKSEIELSNYSKQICNEAKYNCSLCKLHNCCFGYYDNDTNKILHTNKIAYGIKNPLKEIQIKIE